MKRENRYSVDKNNQLLIKPGNKSAVLRPRGRFSIEKNNALVFWLNEPDAWRQEYGLPNKIKFKGNWWLNANHDLQLNLDKTKQQFKGDYLRLRGKILCAERESFAFQIKSRDRQGVNRFSFLKLSGIWQADRFNRITFEVKKKTKPDTLVFKGAWQVNKNQQIIYEYEKTELKTKRKIRNSLILIGFWQISSANCLSYILSGSSQSRFDFRVQLQTPNVYPKKGAIKYRLGIGVRKGLSSRQLHWHEGIQPARIRIITLYGTWKFSRRLGLCFEMDYGRGRVRRQIFGAEVNLCQSDKVIFRLVDKQHKRLGISVIFRHRFLSQRDAEWFLRLKQDFKEKRIEARVEIPF